MTPEQFCYWLNGFGELSPEPPTPEQWKAIKEHLALAFHKVTPPAPGDDWARKAIGFPYGDKDRAVRWPGYPPIVTC